jgi:hypothetical protein
LWLCKTYLLSGHDAPCMQQEIIRTGPSARLAASMLGGALGRPPKRAQPKPKPKPAPAAESPVHVETEVPEPRALTTAELVSRKRSQESRVGGTVFDRLSGAGRTLGCFSPLVNKHALLAALVEGKRPKQTPTEAMTR